MIKFKDLTSQNFMSVGNKPITIQLDRTSTTLITGTNGAGKSSTILDGLSFVLFGKPHRKINKPQLINSINDRNCLVTVNFDIGSDEYKISRGIKPNIFEIWKNGTMINQDSKTRDYQKVLEQNILKLNHKTFHQIVVLGSSNFTPFMQLSNWNRREVIEDLLDITVFSTMNVLLKEQKKSINDLVFAIEAELNSLKKQGEMQKKHIKHLKSISADNARCIEDEIEKLVKKKEELEDKLKVLSKQLTDKTKDIIDTKIAEVTKEKKNLYGMEGKAKSRLAELEKNTKFYTTHDKCPTCTQAIDEAVKTGIVTKNTKETGEITTNIETLDKQIEQTEALHVELNSKASELKALAKDRDYYNSTITDIIADISAKQHRLSNLTQDDSITKAINQLNEIAETGIDKHKQRMSQVEELEYMSIMEELLKDTGIKTQVIKQYLPVMNRFINEYLRIFDFFVSFNLDENFTESIRSRHRDEFTYTSFSEGEKAKIDVSLMLTWRQIAKMKNSTNTNLLIMDEIFDQSLDTTSVESLMNIFKSLTDTNIFVISHNTDHAEEYFERQLVFTKPNNFTELSEIEEDV